jgi:HK97 family phage major capsid protein
MLSDFLKERAELLGRADAITSSVERAGRPMTTQEGREVDDALAGVSVLNKKIQGIQSNNSITRMSGPNGRFLMDTAPNGERLRPRAFSHEYASDLLAHIQSNGRKTSDSLLDQADSVGGYPLVQLGAALYEGSSPAGGYAVPIVVDDQIVPLAPKEMAVRRLASIIPTTSDVKFPVKASFGTASAKAETSSFTESELTLGQFTLSAFMAGILEEISWELAQDVPAFQAVAVDDMVLAQQMYEENLYINGTGSGQAQGLIGNVGTGITDEPDANGNLVSINATLDVMAALNAVYWPTSSWLMARATSTIIRKAQMQSNLFFPAFTSVNGQDYLHGRPVEYSAAMPVAARGSCPVLFGDFKRGYIIGDRGGSGINVKVLDQPLATQGIIVLLAYRRTDGRVRRSEAIQALNVAAS